VQIEEKMDLILSRRDSFKQALPRWKESWAPALIEYGSNLHENIYEDAQMFEGVAVTCPRSVPLL